MAENKVEFILTAEERDFINGMKAAGVSVDQLKSKMAGLNKTAGDRQINKALGQDTVGDFLELFGINEQGLAVIKTAGLTIGAFNAVASSTAKILNGIRDDKAASEIWADIAKGIPILGSAAKAAEDLGAALAENYQYSWLYGLQRAESMSGIKDKGKREDADLAARKALLGGIGSDAAKAREEALIGNASSEAAMRAEIDLAKTKSGTATRRNQILGLGRGISNEARKKALDELVAIEQAALEKWQRATEKANDESHKKIDADNKERLDKERKDAEESTRIAEQKAKDKEDAERRYNAVIKEQSDLQDRIFGKQLNIENQISQIERERADRISSQLGGGALAATFGLGTANQIASQERASSNPLVDLSKQHLKKEDEQIKYLKYIWGLLQSGTDPQDIFGL